ncbi:hypothetical protein [uncultured Roseovarius sp.]|uniref:hypothetical protein n=1 Tax=uncultured Roseovarius sp. TaxID=293344 RepID=UPI00260C2033|nr:hypothetical protein [uncultured Roseovarius sp.]
MRLNNRIKKLEDLTGINATEYPEIIFYNVCHRDERGELQSEPYCAMFVGRDCETLLADDGEARDEFSARAQAHLEHLKQTKETRT